MKMCCAGVADAAGTSWTTTRVGASDFERIKQLIQDENDREYDENDISDVRCMIEFTDVIEYNGRIYKSRPYELKKNVTKTCNSVCFVDWGDRDDMKHATVAVLNGFYKVQMSDDDVFHFAKIRTCLERKCQYTGCRRIDIKRSPSEAALAGEIIQISQIHAGVSPVLLPEVTVIPMQRGQFDMSFSKNMYVVCPVYT